MQGWSGRFRSWWRIAAIFLCAGGVHAQQLESQIERARDYGTSLGPSESQLPASAAAPDIAAVSSDETSDVGGQWILKERPERNLFGLSAGAAGYYTNNVALTRRGELPEYFMIADAGGSARVPIAPWIQGEFDVRFSIFRYQEYPQLDFNSIDVGTGLTAQLASLWNISPFLRYNFTALFSDETGDTFFKNHLVTVGAQKVFPLAPAHYLYAGGAAAFGFSDPADARRNEYSLFAGYHLEVTRALGLDLNYRLAWLQYVENDRADLNQSVSLGLRYRVADWLSTSASVAYTRSVSDDSAFDYQAINTGAGLSLSIQF